MSRDERVATLLREAAQEMQVSSGMPAGLGRRVRLRQASVVGAAVLSIVALSVVAVSVPRDSSVAPADDGNSVRTLTSGELNGISWRMEFRPGADEFRRDDRVCIRAGSESDCWHLREHRYGGADVMNVMPGYLDALDAAVIVVRCPPGCDGVFIREVAGPAWAGLLASEDEGGAFFYRFFEGKELDAVLSVEGIDVPTLRVSVRARGATVKTGVGVTRSEYPDLKEFPGDKRPVESSPEFGGYSVVLREADSEVCLHIGERYRCRDPSATAEPLRLWILQPLECEAADECPPGYKAVVIAGEVGLDVVRIGIRDEVGTSFVQVGEPFGPRLFSTYVYARPGDRLELIALDASDDELDSVTTTVPDE